ncbi:MAG: cysteine desulfurase [Armatimonadetes bacterium]|nr:cysteine desulfurase [Armatimonadota bacterium]MDE2208025.1 cysteine desulfurase [Armatimonadota bacterium]
METRAVIPQEYAVESVRAQFPALHQLVHGKPLIYLDNAATTQKPDVVLDALSGYYRNDNANVHRGVHELSARATDAYEGARDQVRSFLGANKVEEIIFTRGATESINLVAQSFGRANVGAGDEVLITGMEHHSNIVPWQMLCTERGAKLCVAPISVSGELMPGEWERRLTPRTRIAAVTHMSNALGTVNPVRELVAIAHRAGVPVLVDGAQAAYHVPVNVADLGCDFYAFSGHKVYGPTGIGVLYGREDLLRAMPPWQGGGDMIASVTFTGSTWNDLPWKFEAGTPHIAGAIGLAAALRFLSGLGMAAVGKHEHDLLKYAEERLMEVPGLRIVGTAAAKASVHSFVMQAAHPHDIGTIVDREGVAIRTGHHCAQPVMQRFGIPATARMSLACYNTRADVDALAQSLYKVVRLMGGEG